MRVSTPLPPLLLKCLKIRVRKKIFFLGEMKLQQMLVGVYTLASLSVLAEAARHCTVGTGLELLQSGTARPLLGLPWHPGVELAVPCQNSFVCDGAAPLCLKALGD